MDIQTVDLENLKKVVKKFEQNINEYSDLKYDETSTRVDFINQFFMCFGWDVNNEKALHPLNRDVIHEATVYVEEFGKMVYKKPDYLFQVDGTPAFYVEAKKPSVDILNDTETSFQLRRYGWSAGFEYSILTNFKDFVVYDCTVKPEVNDSINTAVIARFKYEEYEKKYNEIFQYISKKNIIERKHDIRLQRKLSSFDIFFLNQISRWRISLATDVYINYPNIDEETLNIFVQKFINRSLFLRICEDNDFETFEQLLKVDSFLSLKSIFIESDRIYNSGIFHYLEEQEFQVSIEVLTEIFKDLYFPRSPYDFSVIPTTILAKVYDIFLQEKISISNNRVEIVKKVESKDFLGAITTPVEIADRIVKESIEKRLSKGNILPEEIKVADICCGSGIFLISAFNYIYELTLKDTLKDKDNNLILGDLINSPEGYRLPYRKVKNLLQSCIYGSDIDSSAIEVCKFSLLLNCLRYLRKEEFNILKSKGEILPNIDNNIIYGNSLVNSIFYSYIDEEKIENAVSVINSVNPVDLLDEFGISNKFDVVVGNPPYIRVQKMSRYSPIEYNFYKSKFCNFQLSKISQLDKYYLFIEKSLSILDSQFGVCGYLVPNRFLHEKNGVHLRRFLKESNSISKIINFNELQLFEGVSTYTCILIFDNIKSNLLEYISITDKSDLSFIEQSNQIVNIDKNRLGEKPWETYSKSIRSWYDKLDNRYCKANELIDIFVGLQTSSDSIYFIESEKISNGLVYFHDLNGEERVIEKSILKDAINKVRLKKFEKIVTNKYLLFPYKNGKLIPLKNLKEEYPFAFQYLESFKEVLKQRSITPVNNINEEWYRYGRNQSIRKFETGEQLIWSVLTLHTNFVYTNSPIPFTGGGNGPYYGLKLRNSDSYSLFYIQAILNSSFISKYIEESSIYFENGYFTTGKQFVENVPIRKIDFTNKNEKEIHDKIVNITIELMNLSENNFMNQNEIKRIKRLKVYKNDELESLVKRLYGVE